MENNKELKVQKGMSLVISTMKNRVYDIIAIGLLIAMLALHLGVIELRNITFLNLVNICLECIPFLLTAVLLSVNFYHKGTFTGKNTTNYINTAKTYSNLVVNLTGHEVEVLPDFCYEYNNEALKKMQTNMLKRAAITYERFNDYTLDNDSNELEPLKVMTEAQLLELYNKERVQIILKAKKLKVKGLNENLLLSNIKSEDCTDVGDDEHDMDVKNTKKSVVSYAVCTIVLSLIGIKDILAWGWAGLLLAIFKLLYILCSSYFKYFKGYNDVTIKLSNHIGRKTDILKQFLYWFKVKYGNDSNKELDSTEQLKMQL